MIACVPAAVVGLLFDDILDKIFYKPLPVAVMLIVYGVLFIIVETVMKEENRLSAESLNWILRCCCGSVLSRCWP